MIYAAEWVASLLFLLFIGARLLEVFEAVFGNSQSYSPPAPTKIITCHYCGKHLHDGTTRCWSCNAFYRK